MHAFAVLRGVLAALAAGVTLVSLGSGRPLEMLPVAAIYGTIFAAPFLLSAFVVAWIAASANAVLRWYHAPLIAGVLGAAIALLATDSAVTVLAAFVLLGALGGVAWLGAFGLSASVPFALAPRES